MSHGFTLIELIVVIVILGVLAATALPKFMDLRSEARTAAIQAAFGTVKSTADMVHAKCRAQGCSALAYEPVTIDGVTRSVRYGYPVAWPYSGRWDITELVTLSGLTVTGSSNIAYFTDNSAPTPVNCQITYNANTANSPPSITAVTSGC